MKYNELKVVSSKSKKRVGRGIAAGQGKTAGRGTKGQKSRTGYSKRPGFEGGQNPLMQRVPKLRGFRSARVKPEVVYTGQLDKLSGKIIDAKSLFDYGLISSPFVSIKVLSKGEVSKKNAVKLPAASANAIIQIQKAGGSFTPTPRSSRPTTNSKTDDNKAVIKPA